MIFKKNGRLYGDIESLLNECCEINQYCFQCALHGKIGTKSCAGYAAENPEEVARLLDATVIKDKPITAEAVEKHSEDEKRRLTRADILHAAESASRTTARRRIILRRSRNFGKHTSGARA